MNRVPSLQELALLNMRVVDVAHPNLLFETYPRDCHIIPKMIFETGKRIFLNHLFLRDERFAEQWDEANGHFCVLDNGHGKIQCWCSCSRVIPNCSCGCMHTFYILLELITEDYGTLNMKTKLKYALARPNDEF